VSKPMPARPVDAPVPKPEPVSEPELVAEPASEPEVVAEPAPEPEVVAELASEPEVVAEPAPEPEQVGEAADAGVPEIAEPVTRHAAVNGIPKSRHKKKKHRDQKSVKDTVGAH